MTHAQMDELYDLFALGALEPELAAEIEQHLRDECVYCREHVNEAIRFAASLVGMTEVVQAPERLRGRVLAAVSPVRIERPRPARNWMFAIAGLSAACLALAALSIGLRSELQQAEQQLGSTSAQREQLRSALASQTNSERLQVAALTAERDRLRSALALANTTAASQVAALTAQRERARADLARETSAAQSQVAALTADREQVRSTLTSAVDAARAQVAALTAERDQLRVALSTANTQARTQMAALEGERDQLESALAVIRKPDTKSIRFGTPSAPHGWVFANRNGGLVLVGSQLPQVASDRTLELWLVPKTGTPQPAGLFRPTDQAGDTVHVSSLAVNPSEIKAVAVSEEPRQGSTAPTTKPFLLVPLS